MLHFNKIAVVGATGNVGSTLLKILAQIKFPAEKLILVASERSAGKKILYLDQELTVHALNTFDFSQVQLAFFAAGSEAAKQYAPIAAQNNCYVIDKSSYFRLHTDVPLIVPEVNGHILKNNSSKIIAVPNCSTIQFVMALKPLHDLAQIQRVDVATYQAVSGAGLKGTEALENELKSSMSEAPFSFGQPIAHNVIPKIDELIESGFTKEEMKMHDETQKIMQAQFIVNATAVRVPVKSGHSEAVHLQTVRPFTIKQAAEVLSHFPGVEYLASEIPTPATHAINSPLVWIGRLRRHPSDTDHYLNFWIVADNLYKGAAWNAIQIAEMISEI